MSICHISAAFSSLHTKQMMIDKIFTSPPLSTKQIPILYRKGGGASKENNVFFKTTQRHMLAHTVLGRLRGKKNHVPLKLPLQVAVPCMLIW